MTFQTVQPKTRNEIRAEITNHPRWPEIRTRDNLRSDALDAATLRRLCNELGISETKEVPSQAPQQASEPTPVPVQPSEPVQAPVATPTPQPVKETPPAPRRPRDGLTEAIEAIVYGVLDTYKAQLEPASLEATIIPLIEKFGKMPAHVKLTLTTALNVTTTKETLIHHKYPLVLSALAMGLNVLLVGPAGSGKTTLASQAAEALSLPFRMTGAVNSEYKLSGFRNANGDLVDTEFRQSYVNGGLFLFDEIDASDPMALIFANAASANPFAEFADGTLSRHENFRLIAAANTYGTGASRKYIRNQLDGASLDRWVVIDFDYDPALEAAMLGLEKPHGAPVPVSIEPREDDYVQSRMNAVLLKALRLREACDKLGLMHIISPRATQAYAKLLKAGWPVDAIEQSVFYRGLDRETVNQLKSSAGVM